jgi:hypothetical protein
MPSTENEQEQTDYVPKGLQGLFGNAPQVPHDHVELAHLPALLDKIPIYQKKVKDLAAEVERLAEKMGPLTWDNTLVIQQLIFKTFFADLGNRAFSNLGNNGIEDVILRTKTNIVHEGLIKSRNLSCEVCGENRSTDRCHIIPRKLGGSWEIRNVLVLCPTHHRLFDRFMLSRAEFAAIDWDKKAPPSQKYADTVILEAHQKFWRNVEEGEHARVSEFDRESQPFVKHVMLEILALFAEKKVLKRNSIYKVIDPELREFSKKIMTRLVKENILLQHRSGKDMYYLVKPLSAKKLDALAIRIWQYVL